MLRLGTFWRHKGLALAVLFSGVLLMLGACARGDVVPEEPSPSQGRSSADRPSYGGSAPAAVNGGLGDPHDIPPASPPSLTEVLSSSEIAVLGRVISIEYEAFPIPHSYVSPALSCYEPPVRINPKTGEPYPTEGVGKPSAADLAVPPPGAKVVQRDGAALFWYKEAESPRESVYRVEVAQSLDVSHTDTDAAASPSPGGVIVVNGNMLGRMTTQTDYLLLLEKGRERPWEQYWSARFIEETRQAFRECDQEIIQTVEDFLQPFVSYLQLQEKEEQTSFQDSQSGYGRFLVGPDGRLQPDIGSVPLASPPGAGPSIVNELDGLTPQEAIAKVEAAIQEG